MRRPKTSFLILLAATAIAAFGLAACGSDDEGGSDTTAATASTSSGETSSTGSDGTGSTASNGDLGTATSTTPSTPEQSAEIEDLLVQAVAAQLQQSGVSEETATCIQENIRNSITPDDIRQLRSGITPPNLRSATQSAAQACLEK